MAFRQSDCAPMQYVVCSSGIDKNCTVRGVFHNSPRTHSNNVLTLHGQLLLQFHFILNVAVGGTSGYFPDECINRNGAFPKPWWNGDTWNAHQQFWLKSHDWLWTWNEFEWNDGAMEVDYIRVWQKM